MRFSFPWDASGQPLRFDAFMQAALHDPQHGYYGRRIREVGARGDFSTSATLSGLLGRGLADWARQALKATGCRDLIEIGPGSGQLAEAVRAAFPWHGKPRLHLVESSPPLREQQQGRRGLARARWHATLAEALTACSGRACIYSNELVDAFPVRRFRREPGGWSEQWLSPTGEAWRPCDALPDSTGFDREWPQGQIVEVHESYHTWLGQQLSGWTAGRMLTIDYGAEVSALYPRQPGGSLRAYFHHQCFTGPEAWARPGHQDLTADVNFSDLRRWAGADFRQLQTQAEFLRKQEPHDAADDFLTDPHGAGGAFLVMETERCADG